MKRSILGILELTAVSGSSTVEWVTAKEGVSFREGERNGEIAGAGGDVDWWAQIKQSLARDGFSDELVWWMSEYSTDRLVRLPITF